jgi:cobalt/nickel transport system ATP-binding protein
MHLHVDQYAHLESPLHRWNPRVKFVALFALIVAFSLVRDLAYVPLMLAVTALIFALSRLPLGFLITRLRYPGVFLLALVVILPLFSGQTVLWQVGPLAIRTEGLTLMLLVVARFTAILTVSLVIFGTMTLTTSAQTLRGLGVPALLVDMLLLTLRYLFEFADMLARMQTAMRLRGFSVRRSGLNRRSAAQVGGLIGTLLIRSFEQAEHVYKAMRLRGYGGRAQTSTTGTDAAPVASSPDRAASVPALEVRGLRFAYPGRPPVLDGIGLTVAHGERVGLIGPNGAGKTSLFLSVCGVLTPDAGTVAVYGEPVRAGHYHPQIGLVFQNPNDQLFSPTVRDDVAFGPVNAGLDAEAAAQRATEALTLTGSAHLIDRAPHHLSGGEKRMVAIAGVLALRPALVLYDEPDANLDMRARRRLIGFLKDAPHTLVLASHDLEMILEVCDRVLLLDGGRIVADGVPRQIMGDAALMEAHGLEKPHSLIPHSHLNPNGAKPGAV